MIVLMSPSQLTILNRASRHFRNMLGDDLGASRDLQPMFRGSSEGLSIGLAHSIDAHHFIVRETVTPETIEWTEAICDHLAVVLSELCHRVMASHTG